MCEAEKRWLEVKSKEWEAEGIKKGIEQGIEQGIERGSEKKELEMYQKMMDKGFEIKAIASIFSVSEESIEKLLMKAQANLKRDGFEKEDTFFCSMFVTIDRRR